jgi:phosphocarrier protein
MVITRTLEIINNLGIHARAAAKIVSLAGRFKARITLERDGVAVNGKSILGILTLACPRGAFLTVTTEGNDAAEAMEAIEQLFAAKFDEE